MKPGDLITIKRGWSPIAFTGILLSSRIRKIGSRYDVYKLLLTDGRARDVVMDISSDSIDVLVQTDPLSG